MAPREVLNEIGCKDDILYRWAKKQGRMFVEPSEEQIEIVKEILANYPSLIKLEGTYAADPWIIAMAIEMVRSQQSTLHDIKRIVVTEEKIRGNKVRIPYVCKAYSIDCIDILDMFRKEGWKF